MDLRRAGWRLAIGMLLSAVVLAGCQQDKEDIGEACQLAPGEVLLNEFMADPDGGPEWIELYNTSDSTVLLNRAVVSVAGDGEPRTISLTGAGSIPPRGYYVIGSDKADYVDYVPHDTLSLNNRSGTVTLSCKNIVADRVDYGGDADRAATPQKGRSVAFDGGATRAESVDHPADYWCPSAATYDTRNHGSPGMPNTVCGVAYCLANDGARAVRAPALGDVRITEILAIPGDGGEQWLEVSAAASSFDLNGMEILNTNANGSQRRWRLAPPECVTLTPGERRVVTFAAAQSEDLVVPFVLTDLGLFKDSGNVSLMRNGEVLDHVRLLPPPQGVSFSQDEDSGEFCPAPAASADSRPGEKSTPGLPNDPCGAVCLDADGSVRRIVSPVPGELVITEVMANPADADDGREWVELYVNSTRAVDLNGLLIVNTNADGNTHTARLQSDACVSVAPAMYVVLAGADAQLDGAIVMPELALYNDPSTLNLVADGAELDRARLPAAQSGVAVNLDATLLDAVGNDNADAFCYSRSTGLFDGTGTPGRANDLCDACLEHDVWRRLVQPSAGDLVITEVYANPIGADAGREWIEVYVAATAAVDLNGIAIISTNAESGRQHDAVTSGDACQVGHPGDYVLIGGALAPSDGVTPDVIAELDLYNTAASLRLESRHALIDAVTLEAQAEGISTSLDAGLLDSASNDIVGAFCSARSEGHFAGKGTPAAANDPCGAYCLDNGQWRAQVRPAVAELVINEVFANPTGSDNGRDWLELFVNAAAGVDLNGLGVVHRLNETQVKQWRIEQTSCVSVQAGEYAVIAGTNAVSEGVAATVVIDGFDLYSSSVGELRLDVDGDMIDTATVPKAVEGVSQGLDPSLTTPADANDSVDAWCATAAFADASPGSANQACP